MITHFNLYRFTPPKEDNKHADGISTVVSSCL